MAKATPGAKVDFWEAFRYWLKLGCINFGGPAGQIALMHADLVDGRAWIGERLFLRALNFRMLLPGPEAHQLAVYIGWRRRAGLAVHLTQSGPSGPSRPPD